MAHSVAIEGGGTHSRAGLYDAHGALLREAAGGPANPVAYGIRQAASTVAALFHELDAPSDSGLYAGLAGVYSDTLRREMAHALCDTVALRFALVTTDVHPVLAANTAAAPGILVVAGTGSNVLAMVPGGPVQQVGGRGALLGDDGSSYRIAATALRAAARTIDGLEEDTCLTVDLPAAAGLPDFDHFIEWSMNAAKDDIAALARTVLAAVDAGDAVAARIVDAQADALVAQVLRAHTKIGGEDGLPVFTIGGLLENDTRFARVFRRRLVVLAGLRAQAPPLAGHQAVYALSRMTSLPAWAARATPSALPVQLPATENMDTAHPPLDTLSAIEIARTMNTADEATTRAVGACATAIAQVIDLAAAALEKGGRILYTGAGTSGRLGVLDASECPPTFGIPAERVVGLIAGGDRALRHSVEGAEDDREQAGRDLETCALSAKDLLVGIAASGTTPYVLASLETAAARGARTALVCCNPKVTTGAEVIIALDTGAEVLPGSTRLKAGTATKMVLNMITTGAMARAGYIVDGLMAGMTPKNAKLRERAARIVRRLADCDEAAARAALDAAGWHIGHAVLVARDGRTPADAAAVFADAAGNLRAALRIR